MDLVGRYGGEVGFLGLLGLYLKISMYVHIRIHTYRFIVSRACMNVYIH